MTRLFTSGSSILMLLSNMATKNKQRQKGRKENKVTYKDEENNSENENHNKEEEEDVAEKEGRAMKDEEFNLDDVLRLGGTRVSLNVFIILVKSFKHRPLNDTC